MAIRGRYLIGGGQGRKWRSTVSDCLTEQRDEFSKSFGHQSELLFPLLSRICRKRRLLSSKKHYAAGTAKEQGLRSHRSEGRSLGTYYWLLQLVPAHSPPMYQRPPLLMKRKQCLGLKGPTLGICGVTGAFFLVCATAQPFYVDGYCRATQEVVIACASLRTGPTLA